MQCSEYLKQIQTMSLRELDKQFQGALQSVIARPEKFRAVLDLEGPNGCPSFTYDVLRVIVEATVRCCLSAAYSPALNFWICSSTSDQSSCMTL